jgi:hypothetical protein
MSQSSKNLFCQSRNLIVLILFSLVVALALVPGCVSKDTIKFQEKVRKMSAAELRTYYRGINERMKGIDYEMSAQDDRYHYDSKHWVYSTPYSPGKEGYRLMEQRQMIEAEMKRRNLEF